MRAPSARLRVAPDGLTGERYPPALGRAKMSVAKHRNKCDCRLSIELWQHETREDQPKQEDGANDY